MEEFVTVLLQGLTSDIGGVLVKAIGLIKKQQSSSKKTAMKAKGKKSIASAKKGISSASESLEAGIKGQFGTAVAELFDKEEKTLEKLSS